MKSYTIEVHFTVSEHSSQAALDSLSNYLRYGANLGFDSEVFCELYSLEDIEEK